MKYSDVCGIDIFASYPKYAPFPALCFPSCDATQTVVISQIIYFHISPSRGSS